jgi:ABC-type transporter lipoprotein component MlaA
MEEQKINTLWTHLHWLSVLAQQGSYTAAAARLGVSKAAMSQRIAELERGQDYYAAIRIAYRQRRASDIRNQDSDATIGPRFRFGVDTD